MKNHETVVVDNLRSVLLKENKELQEELFKRMPLWNKIHSYIFAIVMVGGIFYGIWLVGHMVYALIFKSFR
jgi:2-phosphoglycerate kinase